MPVAPFVIDVPRITLTDLHSRLERTRWPDVMDDDWSSGTSPCYLRHLGEYWRAQERAITGWPQFRADVDGMGIPPSAPDDMR